MSNKKVRNNTTGKVFLHKLRIFRNRLFPMDTKRYKVYHWIFNLIKKLFGIKPDEALIDSFFSKYRKLKAKIFPENSIQCYLCESIKSFIKKAVLLPFHYFVKSPSIAFIIPGEGLSGGIMVICQHANRLIRKGYEVVLVNHNPNDPFKLDWFPDLLAPVIPINALERNYDLIIATQWSTVYTALEMDAKRKFYFIQSNEARFYSSDSKESEMAQQTYNFDFELIVIAKWLKKWLKDEFGKNSYYVPNGLDTSLFYPDKPLEAKNERLRVLLEGPIDIPFKGMKEAFEVVDGMDCEVWCVSSSGKPKPQWHCDRFFERVPLKDMRQIYCSCDVLIKMTKVEGFFMPPLEMMACGGTVITNKVTGYDEYIKDGYNGLVVEQGDVISAREKLSLLIHDRKLLNELQKSGLETARNWSWKSSNNLFEKVLINKS